MQYRMLGRTGLKVSQLGFGAMRLPMKDGKVQRELSTPMIHRAFEAGVNYIDTAVGYCGEDSQRAVGDALKGWRDKVVLSTKNHYFGEDEGEWRKNLENSLERLQTDHIDIYNTHGTDWSNYEKNIAPRVSKWMLKAKAEGLIRHVCTSFHDGNESLVKIVNTGFFEVITLQYNILDRQLEEGIALAHEKGMGVVVMGPVGGGRLGTDTDRLLSILPPNIKRVPEMAIRFVLANPNITMALSGMSTMAQVEENLRIASDKVVLSAEEIKTIGEHLENLKKASDLYCSGCAYCKPCPSGVDIPQVFKIYNEARIYGGWPHAKDVYEWYQDNQKDMADSCTDCLTCVEKCPQKIEIPARLKEAHKALSKK